MICYLPKILMYLGGKWQWEKVRPTSFWFDKWCGDFSLKEKFPLLSEINNEQKNNCSQDG